MRMKLIHNGLPVDFDRLPQHVRYRRRGPETYRVDRDQVGVAVLDEVPLSELLSLLNEGDILRDGWYSGSGEYLGFALPLDVQG